MDDIKDQVAPVDLSVWLEAFHDAFGAPGLMALAYTLACRHGHDIRREFGAMPFLLIIGGPGSGKRALLQVLAQATARVDDFPDASRSTNAGLMRCLQRPEQQYRPLVYSDAGIRTGHCEYFFDSNVYPPPQRLAGEKVPSAPSPGGLILTAASETDVPEPICERSLIIRLSNRVTPGEFWRALDPVYAIEVPQWDDSQVLDTIHLRARYRTTRKAHTARTAITFSELLMPTLPPALSAELDSYVTGLWLAASSSD